jgi:hypothetical protein
MQIFAVFGFLFAVCQAQKYDYQDALSKSILFYEAQRSGPLPEDNRIPFREDSALDDVIVGGYYDGTSTLYVQVDLLFMFKVAILCKLVIMSNLAFRWPVW